MNNPGVFFLSLFHKVQLQRERTCLPAGWPGIGRKFSAKTRTEQWHQLKQFISLISNSTTTIFPATHRWFSMLQQLVSVGPGHWSQWQDEGWPQQCKFILLCTFKKKKVIQGFLSDLAVHCKALKNMHMLFLFLFFEYKAMETSANKAIRSSVCCGPVCRKDCARQSPTCRTTSQHVLGLPHFQQWHVNNCSVQSYYL